ncbi:TOMM precursor leader peptide-binding protein [Paracoccus aminophilus]|uniref:Bacteriocin biosynthesis cyclodehydratase domain-containing protein n=1 Tax=Paracoccus aminophilus JCM 7686 TaxID=1367847 RepID=S5Z0E8_PARAH|nr:TOMM precursor leader peptide-binding protein [Paracoccus aminophilus]AGT10941.1 hypothetical protein JCM7686_pAMI4p251 [Paracoccus aminophilus JCM 7686]
MTRILFLALGEFGHAVATRAAKAEDQITAFPLDDPTGLATMVEAAEFIAVAAFRPYPEAFHALNSLCNALAKPWSLAELSGTRLTIGPLVIPGGKGCYACYRKRRGTHYPTPEREAALEAHYLYRPETGPRGYSPPAAAFAAAALRHDAETALGEGRAALDAAGGLRVADMLTVTVLESAVLPVHACPHCFPASGAGEIGARFVNCLVPALQEPALQENAG